MSSYQRSRVLLLAGLIVAGFVFGAVGHLFHVPAMGGLEGSLVQQPSPSAAMLVTAIALLVATLLGAVFTGSIRFEGGLFVATFGMILLARRGSNIHDAIVATPRPSVFLLLLAELAILTAIIGIGWGLLWCLARVHLVRSPYAADGPPSDEEIQSMSMFARHTVSPLLADSIQRYGKQLQESPHAQGEDSASQKPMATLAAVIITAACVMILAESGAKNQTLASVGFSAFIGTVSAYMMFPARPSFWYWIAPLIVGAAGYVIAYANPAGLAIGFPQGTFGALARPLPLDYASAGTAGAILGYWMARRWQRPEDAESDNPAAA